jgi:hypothetical protein
MRGAACAGTEIAHRIDVRPRYTQSGLDTMATVAASSVTPKESNPSYGLFALLTKYSRISSP